MKINVENKKKLIPNIVLFLLFVIFVVSALMMIKTWEKSQGVYRGENTAETGIEYEGKRYELKKNMQTILVMGLDKFADDISIGSYNNDQQADFLMLIIIDRDKDIYDIVHINRDTMAEITVLGVGGQAIGTEVKQIALSHSYGSGDKDSCRNTVLAVSDFLGGIHIDQYISLTMDAVGIVNDEVGGVTVTVTDDFTGVDDTLIMGEQITLKGEHALNYVRSRFGMKDSTNASRMERQREYINALWEKVIYTANDDDEFLVDISLKLSDYMLTDCTTAQMEGIFERVSSYSAPEIRTIAGKSVRGENFMEFYADEEALQKLIIELFYEIKE